MDTNTRRDTQVTEPQGTCLPNLTYKDFLDQIGQADVRGLRKAELSYGDSWKRRGGIGAFMMLARKWDRLENVLMPLDDEEGQCSAKITRGTTEQCAPFDILRAAEIDKRPEGIIDDIRDLRRYLILVMSELTARDAGVPGAYLDYIEDVAERLCTSARTDRKPSRFGGVYEFLATADLWGHLETSVELVGYDIFKGGPSGVIRSLAVNLLRIEALLIARGTIHGTHRDNK